MPSDVTGLSGLYSTAADAMAFQQMLLNGGRGPDGLAVLSEEAVAAMTTDQLADDGKLDDKEFNSHAKDRKNSAGRQSGAFGVEAAGQGVGLGLNVVTTPRGARQAAMAGGYSSPACYHGTEWWNDPALGLSVFYGTQLAYGHAVLPDMRQANSLACTETQLPGSRRAPAARSHPGEGRDRRSRGWSTARWCRALRPRTSRGARPAVATPAAWAR